VERRERVVTARMGEAAMVSDSTDVFVERFGRPVIESPGMHVEDPFFDDVLGRCGPGRVGAGWFLGRLFYLFGTGLERLEPCVREWSFLLPDDLERYAILGYNVFGAILLVDAGTGFPHSAPVGLLDPLTMTYHQNDWMDLAALTTGLADHIFPFVVDPGGVYEAFLRREERLLDDDEILGIYEPLSIGGQEVLENFTPIDIVEYYRAVGPSYAQAHEELVGSPSTIHRRVVNVSPSVSAPLTVEST